MRMKKKRKKEGGQREVRMYKWGEEGRHFGSRDDLVSATHHHVLLGRPCRAGVHRYSVLGSSPRGRWSVRSGNDPNSAHPFLFAEPISSR